MGITAVSGPLVSYGITQTSTAGTGISGNQMEYNEERAPSIFDLGNALADPRVAYAYNPGDPVGTQVSGWYNNQGMYDWVPFAASTNAGAVSSTAIPAASSAVTLSPSSSSGFILTTIIAPETGRSVTVYAIESTAATLTFGSGATVELWNPAAGAPRMITINPSSSGDIGPWTIAGRDAYGYKVTESLFSSLAYDGIFNTSDSSGVVLHSRKTYKYISGVTAATSTVTSTGVSIGIGVGFGYPLLVDDPGGYNIYTAMVSSISSAAFVNSYSSTTLFPGSTAATQTSTTPDVRGLYVLSSLSTPTVAGASVTPNAARRWQLGVTPRPSNLASVTSTNVAPLVGATQFSSV